ncbi:MAG: hypothetical protein ACI8QS_003673 [Planctomycetota bacterium]|jgi:hypothetical protein
MTITHFPDISAETGFGLDFYVVDDHGRLRALVYQAIAESGAATDRWPRLFPSLPGSRPAHSLKTDSQCERTCLWPKAAHLPTIRRHPGSAIDPVGQSSGTVPPRTTCAAEDRLQR